MVAHITCPGPDLGLGQTTRGPPHVLSPVFVLFVVFCCCFLFLFFEGGGGGGVVWYSRVGWASTAPLLKAAQGPPHV